MTFLWSAGKGKTIGKFCFLRNTHIYRQSEEQNVGKKNNAKTVQSSSVAVIELENKRVNESSVSVVMQFFQESSGQTRNEILGENQFP